MEETDMDEMERLLEHFEKRCGELAKENTNTLDELNRSVRIAYTLLTLRERHMRMSRGIYDLYPGIMSPDGKD